MVGTPPGVRPVDPNPLGWTAGAWDHHAMYVPGAFAMEPDDAWSELDAVGVGDLVVAGTHGLTGVRLPYLVDRARGVVLGHVARANPLWRHLDDDHDALLVVHGPETYVSPGWYASKRDHGRVVPTWNHVTVHAHGRVRAVHDRGWLRDLVTRLSDRWEAGQDEPWSVDDAPGDHVDRKLRGVVGLELRVGRIEGMAKLSQDKPAADAAGVVTALAGGTPSQRAVARRMSPPPTLDPGGHAS